MPPLDFPSAPAINDTWTGSNGVVYTWDGTKWVVSGSGAGTAYVPIAGNVTMTGPLALYADPTTSPMASTKRYVDNAINLAGNYLGTWAVASNTPNISAGGSISNANYVATTVNPATPEVVPVGVPGIAGMTVANGDRVIWASGLGTWQILRNAGVTLAAADARYYPLATNPSGYQTAAQVTAVLPVASSTTPVMDGTATIGALTTWARADHIHPTDTSRASVASVNAAAAGAANNIGRNLLHNALFTVQQRGIGPWTTNSYTLDRWQLFVALDTVSVIVNAIGDTRRVEIGDEAATFTAQNTFTGNAGTTAVNYLAQKIEGVRRLAGKTVTVSFWAWATTTPKLGVNIQQYFGTGGSPSTTVWAQATGASVTLGTTATRYSVTISIPSIVGKTLGTNNDDFTMPALFFSSGATNNAIAGNIGVQSGVINVWGVQLEIAAAATPLGKPDPRIDRANCQRFYWTALIYVAPATDGSGTQLIYPTTMRAAPTVAGGGAGFASGAASAAGCNVSQTTGGPQTLTFTADL